MVLAFVMAEMESPRFGPGYRFHLPAAGMEALSSGGLLSWMMASEQHAFRRHLLQQCRGYDRNRLLFRGFPACVRWQWCDCSGDELGALMYASFQDWRDLSDGSRRVRDGARRVAAGDMSPLSSHVHAVASRLRTGWRPMPIIVVQDADGQQVILEGHTRATAHAMEAADLSYTVLLGTSVDMHRWAHF